MAQVKGCHLVGSVCLPDTEAVFRQCSAAMPKRLKRIPDGETGSRSYFTFFQSSVLQVSPAIMVEFVDNAPAENKDFTPEEIDEGIEQLKKAGPLETGYDTFAIESYRTFKRMRDEGAISKGTRFQVSLPTTPNILSGLVQAAFQARVEPIYEEALFRAMRKIQEAIPHEDLAIQIDLAVDTALWEGIDMFKPWFGDGDQSKVKEYIVDYVVRMIGQVSKDVEVGIHNCYGDMEHRHFLEPSSLSAVVDRTLRIVSKSPHPFNFLHFPVPISAIDHLDAYLAPLRDLVPKLKEHGTELYLGVVHYNDLETTKKMIQAASAVLGDFSFGVGTECGWGRTPSEQIEGIMQISTEVSQEVL